MAGHHPHPRHDVQTPHQLNQQTPADQIGQHCPPIVAGSLLYPNTQDHQHTQPHTVGDTRSTVLAATYRGWVQGIAGRN